MDPVEIHVFDSGIRVPTALATLLLGAREQANVFGVDTGSRIQCGEGSGGSFKDQPFASFEFFHARGTVTPLFGQALAIHQRRRVYVVVGRNDGVVSIHETSSAFYERKASYGLAEASLIFLGR